MIGVSSGLVQNYEGWWQRCSLYYQASTPIYVNKPQKSINKVKLKVISVKMQHKSKTSVGNSTKYTL